MSDLQYIRANKELISTICKNCHKEILKNNGQQIVYFCCSKCRKKYKEN